MSKTIRVPALSDDQNRTVNALIEQLEAKSKRNKIRSAYYDGRRAVRQVGSVIPPQYASLAQCLGWAAKGVDGLTRRTNIDKFVLPGSDVGDLGMAELEDSNFLLSELAQARTDSALHGVSYLVTTRGDADAGEPAVLVHAKDALNGTGTYNVRRRALDDFLSVTSRDRNGEIDGFVLYEDGVTTSVGKDGRRWAVEVSEHDFGVPVDPMIYRPRSSRRMGRSRITRPVMSIQDAALRAIMRLEAHMDIYAIPKLVLMGGSDSVFKDEQGNIKPAWQMVMGRLLGVPDDEDAENPRADMKQLSAESPEPHLAQLNAQAKLMARETDLPDSDFALSDMANPTSEGSYIQGRDALIAEAEGAMDDWSVSIRKTVTRALAMQNGLTEVPAAWSKLAPSWRSPLYLSRSAQADAGMKQLTAVPWLAETEVGLELLGLTESQIQRATAEKRRAAGRNVIAALQGDVDAS